MTEQEQKTFDEMLKANVQWIEAYAKLRLEKDSLRKDAELGRIAMRFVDRAGDVADCDPAERICSEFHKAMSDAVYQLYVQPREAFASAADMQLDASLKDFQNGYDAGYEAGVLHASMGATQSVQKHPILQLWEDESQAIIDAGWTERTKTFSPQEKNDSQT